MKYRVTVTQTVDVNIPKRAMTEKFMKEFREYMYALHSAEQHAGHLGQLACRGFSMGFVEGYGELEKMGIEVGEPELADVDVGRLK